jgi:hypothetical protein
MRKGIGLIIGLLFLCGAIQPQNVSTSPYGINVHQVGNDILQKVKDAGIKWIRVDVNWFAVEHAKGTYDWAQVDRVTDYAASNGLSMLLVIAYTPGWANGNAGFKFPADNIGDWENFVRLTVNRYKSKVKYWSIWNEPNSTDFFGLGKDEFVARVFLPAAKAIRIADPAAFIVGPELAHLTGTGAEWYFWMKYILTEAGTYIDVVSHHIYKNEGVYLVYEILETGEALIPSVQEVIEETGQRSKPFWITETGWDTATFSEGVQADRYLEMLQERRRKLYPHKLFFYEIIDDPSPGISPWGILRSNGSEKPAYTVYKDFIAGKYPNDGEGVDSGGGEKKKCLAEQVESSRDASGRSQVLSDLRNFRDDILQLFPSARPLVRMYYDFSDELIAHTLSDSRLYRLGIQLLEGSGRFIRRNPLSYLNKNPDPEVMSTAQRWLSLLKQKKLSKPLKKAITWGEGQLKLLKTIPLKEYLMLHPEKSDK